MSGRWTYRRIGMVVAAALVIVALAVGAVLIQRRAMDARLVRAFPDETVKDPDLVRYAADRAAPVFRARCAGCHGADMKGDRRTGAADLTDADWLFGEGRVADIEQTLLYGVRAGLNRGRSQADMPAFGRARPYARYAIPSLSPHELDAVTDYVLTLGGHPQPGADLTLGRALYRDKGQCFDCHETDAKGDSFIGAPNLIDSIWLYGDGGRASVRASVARGHAGVCPAWVKTLSPAVIRALAVFIHQRAQPARAAGAATS